ncbi:LytR/AlgR family response regulator transcription factor [Massilia sp. DWR3-1-1]|uniref:LytR/AlgR family response regulator transcription factor n=1 Tax=Massilia sp. DWR3-1-1 TaxID=2804559 RepID=UPI003CEAF2EA
MRILIVDDEQPARARLRRLLGQCADGAALHIDEARDGVEALALSALARPDVIFLDIEMPEASGLEVAASLPAPAPLVVFVTAYDQYAVPAFDANAIDYLLKPYDLARLERALGRVRQQLRAATPAPAPPHGLPLRQLLVSERGVTRVVRVEQIGWIETADNYVVLHCADAQPLLRQALATLVAGLGPRFVRCHRRAAVQLAWIEHVVSGDKGDGELVLRGGARVPLSRQYRAALLARLAGGDDELA